MNRLQVSAAVVAGAAVLAAAAPANAATSPKAKAIVTTTHAVASHKPVPAGHTFTIIGWVDTGHHALDKQKVYLMERPDAAHKWVRATNIHSNVRMTATVGTANGLVTFAGVKGLKHAEQYRIMHPQQVVGGKLYGASVSVTITITP